MQTPETETVPDALIRPPAEAPAMPPPERWRPADERPDPDDEELFPRLPEPLLEDVARQAVCREFAAGEVLFQQGEPEAPFFVVESGRVVFFDRNRSDGPGVYFAESGAGTFVGDTANFTGEPTVIECRAIEPTRVLELTGEQLRTLVANHADAGDLILRTLMARRAWGEGHGYGQLQVIGPMSRPETLRLREFLGRNQVPFNCRDTEEDAATAGLLRRLGVREEQTPLLLAAGRIHRNPSIADVARGLGLCPDLDDEPYDITVVGGGPGGLAAAVYAASEGLRTLLLEASAPGGQAGTSSKIENYLGFTTGISGAELTRQAVLQARKFGVTISTPTAVNRIDCTGDVKTLRLDDGRSVRARVVVLATGAEYRRLGARGCDRLEGMGVYYAAGHLEAEHVRGKRVMVVGGGNSAGQAAVFLSQRCEHVDLVIRRESLEETMSQYLISRIEAEENIDLLARAEVEALEGPEGELEAAEIRTPEGRRRVPCSAVFCMIGAEPRTGWLRGCCALDDRGFVLTGPEAKASPHFAGHWPLDRDPFLLETTRPGVLAVGDVRAGSVKRVAAAVGEGSMVVTFVHQILGAQAV